MLVDSHCHLDFDEFAHDLDAVMDRARRAGIRRFVTVSLRVRDADRALALAERYDDVFCSVGTHPHHAHEEPDVTVAELVALAAHPRVVAIGEAGLDRHYGSAPWNAQMRSLRIQIAAAREARLPLVIHSVREDAAMAAVLREEDGIGRFSVVMHCFSGGPELARICLSLGHVLSFSGLLTHDGQDALRSLAATLPADRILVETDSPSLPPAPVGSLRNEPAHLGHVVAALARCRGEAPEAVARQTTATFHRIFTKVVPA